MAVGLPSSLFSQISEDEGLSALGSKSKIYTSIQSPQYSAHKSIHLPQNKRTDCQETTNNNSSNSRSKASINTTTVCALVCRDTLVMHRY